MAGTAGSVAPVFRDGGYDDTVIYDFYHALIHNNKLYFCRQDGTIGHEPQEESDEYWFLSLDGNFGDAKKLGGETAAQWQAKIDVEKERIDQIVAMGESTGGNVESEVFDMRIGADGITYDSAGTAVREQIGNLDGKIDNEISSVKSDLSKITENMKEKDITNLITITGYITAEGAVKSNDAFKRSDYIEVKKGSLITYTDLRSTYASIIATYNSNKEFDAENSVIDELGKKQSGIFEMPYDGYVIISCRLVELEENATANVTVVNAIGANFNVLDNRIVSIENSLPDSLPDYWETYLDEKIPSIVEKDMLVGNSGDSFVFITDVHIPRNSMYSPLLIKNICENTSVDKVFNGGDYLDDDTGEDGKNTAVNTLLSWRKQSMTEYAVRGNHDLNNYDGNNESNALTLGEWYSLMVKQAEKYANTDKKDYFVVDNDSQKVRYIVMCSEGDRPTTWLQEKLTEVDSEWTVLIMQHRYWGSTTDSVSNAGNLIVEAINSVYTNIKARLVGIICGHTHADYAITESTNGYLIIATTCDALTGEGERTKGTTTEQAFDVVHLDTANRKLYMTRIGSGSDREFSY